MELTPNRECLSVLGLARDLNVFGRSKVIDVYEDHIDDLEIDFKIVRH